MSEHQPKKSNKTESINIREILFKYLHKWYWFLISLLAFVFIAFFYLQTTNNKYSVETSILLRSNKSKGLMGGGDQSAIFESLGFASMGNKQIDDEIQVLRSKEIMKNVILSMEINTEYYKKKKLRYVELYPSSPLKLIVHPTISDTMKQELHMSVKHTARGFRIKYKYGKIKDVIQLKDLSKPFSTPIGKLSLTQIGKLDKNDVYRIIHYPMQNIVEKHTESIKVMEVNKRANAIKITTDAANTAKAIDMLNMLIEYYNMDAVIDKNLFASNTAKFIDDRLSIIKEELYDAELEVEDYKKKYNLTNIQTEVELLLETNVEYQKEIERIENQINIIEFVVDHLNKGDQTTTIPMNLGLDSEVLAKMVYEYNETVLMRMKLERTSLPTNPSLKQANQQIDELRRSILESVASMKQSLQITKNGLMKKDELFYSKIKGVPTYEREFTQIIRHQSLKNGLYVFLMEKREENAMTLASAVPSAKILDQPNASILPVSPKKMIILGFALIFGLAFPFFILHIYDILNNKIADKRELLKLIDAPYLGSIMNVKDQEKIQVREGVTTPIVELFRLMRTNLQFMIGAKKSPVILVTSSIGGEGKSFISINLAMTFALVHKKVVLVGLDIRKPMLTEYLHIAKNSGVSMYLSDESYQLKDVLVPSGIHPSLFVVPAGPVPPNPGELLMSERLDQLFVELRKEFDIIIVDSAPIGKVSDTYLLNRVVDNTVYISRQEFTPRDVTELINDIYENKKLNNIGVILNGVSHSSSSGYGYGYGYT